MPPVAHVDAEPEAAEAITSFAQWFAIVLLNSDAGIGNIQPTDEEGQHFAAEVRRLNPDWQPGQLAPRLPDVSPVVLSAHRPAPRAREARPSGRRSTRISTGASGDRDPPPPRTCAYCGRKIDSPRPNKYHCSPSHRVMACRTRKRERERPTGVTPQSLQASFAALNGYAALLPANFPARVLTDLEARGYARRLSDGSFAATDWAREELRDFRPVTA